MTVADQSASSSAETDGLPSRLTSVGNHLLGRVPLIWNGGLPTLLEPPVWIEGQSGHGTSRRSIAAGPRCQKRSAATRLISASSDVIACYLEHGRRPRSLIGVLRNARPVMNAGTDN